MVNIKDINFENYKEVNFDFIHLIKKCDTFDKMLYALDIDSLETSDKYISEKIKAYRYIAMGNIHNTESGNSPDVTILTYEGEALFVCYNYGYDDLHMIDFLQVVDTKPLKDRFDNFIKDMLKLKCIEKINAAEYYVSSLDDNEVSLTYTLDVLSFIPGYHRMAYYRNKLVEVKGSYPITNRATAV